MFGRLIRIIVGLVAAFLAAGFTKVFFAYTPAELSSLPPDVAADRLSRAVELGLYAAVQGGAFALPFAVVAAAVGEWLRIHAWTYYALWGMAVALLGFYVQSSTEGPGSATIVNNYALTAFLTTGFIGGFVYWLFSGRYAAGHRSAATATAAATPAAPAKPANGDAKAAEPKAAESKPAVAAAAAKTAGSKPSGGKADKGKA